MTSTFRLTYGISAVTWNSEWPAYLAYVTSFLTIGGVWIAHHRVFSGLRFVNSTMMRINLVLLMMTAFLPFPTGILALVGFPKVAASLYLALVARGLERAAEGPPSDRLSTLFGATLPVTVIPLVVLLGSLADQQIDDDLSRISVSTLGALTSSEGFSASRRAKRRLPSRSA